MENKNFIIFFTSTVIMCMTSATMVSIEEGKEILRARRAAAPRSYMHAEDCKGVNRTFALMNDYPFCQSFVVCDPAGHKYVYDCPSGLWFNETTQECDYPENLEKEFQEECGNLISSFEANFFKQMAANKKNKPIATNNQESELRQESEPRKRPIGSKKRKQNIVTNSEEITQIPQYIEESQPVVTSRRRVKPQLAIVTQSSENMAYEYYETPQDSMGHVSSVPALPNKDFTIPDQPLRNSKPNQITTQSPFQTVHGNDYDYYDSPMPQIQPTPLRLPPQQMNPQQRPKQSSQSLLPQQQIFENFPQQSFQQRPQQINQRFPDQTFPQRPQQTFPQRPQSAFQQHAQQTNQQSPQQKSQHPQISQFSQSLLPQREETPHQLSQLRQEQAFANVRGQRKNDIE